MNLKKLLLFKSRDWKFMLMRISRVGEEAFLFHNYNKDYDKLVTIDPDIKTLDKILLLIVSKTQPKKKRGLYNKQKLSLGF